MINNKKWHTATVAEIFAKQGYLNYSQKIYENLLKKTPNNVRLKKGYTQLLNEIEMKRQTLSNISEPSKELIFFFSEWINLILKSKKLNELERFRKRYNS